MTEIEKLKYEIEIDTSTLGPQLALAQTQIGSALSDQVGVGMAAQLPRGTGGVGMGDVVFAVGHPGNLGFQQAAFFGQTATQDARMAQMGAVAAPIIVPTPVPMMMPQMAAQAQYGPPAPPSWGGPGMAAMGFAPSVSVGPMGLLFGGGMTRAAPWATPEEENAAVSMARRNLAFDIGVQAADWAAWGGGSMAGLSIMRNFGWIGKGVGILGGGMLASSILMGGVEAVRDVNRWGEVFATYGIPRDDAFRMAYDFHGYSGWLGVLGRGMLENVDFTGILKMERASRIASDYGLRSRAARDDPDYLSRQAAFGFARGYTDRIYGDVIGQSVDYALAIDVAQTLFKGDEPQARQVAQRMLEGGATVQSLAALRSIDIWSPIVETYMQPGVTRPQALAQIAIDFPRMAGSPLARASDDPMRFAQHLMASRSQMSQIFYGGAFGEVRDLTGMGVTPNTVMSDLTTLGAFSAQAPEAMALIAGAVGTMDDLDPQTVYKRLSGLSKAGDIRGVIQKKISDIQGGGTKEILKMYRNYHTVSDLARKDPKVAYALTMAHINMLQDVTGQDTETITLWLETNAAATGFDPIVARSGLKYHRDMGDYQSVLDYYSLSSVTTEEAMEATRSHRVIFDDVRLTGIGEEVPNKTVMQLADIALSNLEEFGLDDSFTFTEEDPTYTGRPDAGGNVNNAWTRDFHRNMENVFGLKYENMKWRWTDHEKRARAAEVVGRNQAFARKIMGFITQEGGILTSDILPIMKAPGSHAIVEKIRERLPSSERKKWDEFVKSAEAYAADPDTMNVPYGVVFDSATRSALGVSGNINTALDELSVGIMDFKKSVESVKQRLSSKYAQPVENY